MATNSDVSSSSNGGIPSMGIDANTDLSGLGNSVGTAAGAVANSFERQDGYKIVDLDQAGSAEATGYGSGTQSTDFIENEQRIDAEHQATGAAISSTAAAAAYIPVYGWAAALVLGIGGALTSAGVFKSKSKEKARAEEDRNVVKGEYMNRLQNESEAKRQHAIANTYGDGGSLNEYLNLFSEGGATNMNLSEGYKEITAGGSHEESPFKGVTIGADQNGTPNKVEEGEFIFDSPTGQYVFTDRF